MPTPSATSRITRRNQTTVPPAVRTVLGLEAGQELGYVIEGSTVRLVNASAEQEHEDPVVVGILNLVAADLELHPNRAALFPAELLARARAATQDVEIDHDAPIDGVTAL